MDRKQFVETYGPVAEVTGQKLGVDPQVLLGQWGLETGWGKSIIPGTNNPGNIKDFSGKGTAAKDNMTGSVDKYRTFSSPEEFGNAYASLISRKYPKAVGAGGDATAYATALKAGGYAEDPGYIKKVASAAEKVLDFFVPSAQAATNDPFADFKPTTPAKKDTHPDVMNDPFADFKPAKASTPTKQAEPGWFEPGSKSEAAVRGFSQGATLGFGDEIQAGIRAGVDKLTGNTDKSFTDQYAQYRDEERKANTAAAEKNTASYVAGNIAGAAPSAIAAIPTAGVKAAAAGGAGYGAVTGLGTGEGTVGEQAKNVAANAAIGGVAAPVVNAAAPVIGAAATAGLPAAVKAGGKAAIKEGAEWTGATGLWNIGKNVLRKMAGGEVPENAVTQAAKDVIKPTITHSSPVGPVIAGVATASKGIVEGAKAGVQATKQALAANAERQPQWSGLFGRLKSNPETAETAAQDMFVGQQTNPAVRQEVLDKPAYLRRQKMVNTPEPTTPSAPPPKPAGPTLEQLAGKKPAPVEQPAPVESAPTINKNERFGKLREYMKNEKVEQPPVVETAPVVEQPVPVAKAPKGKKAPAGESAYDRTQRMILENRTPEQQARIDALKAEVRSAPYEPYTPPNANELSIEEMLAAVRARKAK